MRFARKIFVSAVVAVLLGILAWQGYLTLRYRLYDGYKAALSGPAPYEEGTPFAAIEDASPSVEGMALAAENERLKLYVDPSSGNVAVADKIRGTVTYAVPPGAEEDPVAAGVNKSLLQSPLSLEYFNKDRLPARMNSYDHAVALGQFRLESVENGVRCVYTMGDLTGPTGLVPIYITQERLDSFLDKIVGTRQYTRNRMRYVESKTVPGHLELMESIRTAKASLRELEEVLISVGYTQEDYDADMSGAGAEEAIPLHFVVPLEYRLDGDSLTVCVDTGHVEEYAGGRIEEIQLMRAFAAGGSDEEGYLMVPNGSGSLIRFNNGKLNADEYTQYIYGQDPLMSEYVTLGNSQPARFPYYGFYRPEQTILACMESGESLAMLTAGVSGKYNAYNYAYPTYVLRGSMSLAMFGMTGNESTLPIVESGMPAVKLAIRYSFLPEGYDGYSGMARYAREQLTQEGVLSPSSGQGDIPFYMDLVGSVMGQKFIAGVSYMGQIPMTTYEDAGTIVGELSASGIEHQVVNYQGWYNRGYYQDTADKIKPVGALGRVGELEALAHALENQGGKLYSDVLFQNVPFSSKRFRYTMESSRYYGGGMSAAFGQVNPITLHNTFSMGYREVMYNILSPRFLTRYVESYNRAFSRYELTGTSLRDLGDTLASDRKRTGMIDREQAKAVVSYSLTQLENQGNLIMISGGNFYALNASDDLINVPLTHNALYLTDDEIPFYEMLIHGAIPYAGEAINLSDAYDERDIALRLVEYGASPHFTFTAVSAGEMKYTGLNRMYSTYWESWKDTAVSIYHTVNGVLSRISGSAVDTHEILDGGLRRVRYENGVEILINRSESRQTLDGVTLEPMSFALKEGPA